MTSTNNFTYQDTPGTSQSHRVTTVSTSGRSRCSSARRLSAHKISHFGVLFAGLAEFLSGFGASLDSGDVPRLNRATFVGAPGAGFLCYCVFTSSHYTYGNNHNGSEARPQHDASYTSLVTTTVRLPQLQQPWMTTTTMTATSMRLQQPQQL